MCGVSGDVRSHEPVYASVISSGDGLAHVACLAVDNSYGHRKPGGL